MATARQQFGFAAEEAAAKFLQSHGYEILGRHVTNRYGELDIVAMDGKTLVAVEVKARRSQRFGSAAESITPKKIEKLVATLDAAALQHGWERENIRVDVVTLESGAVPGQFSISHFIGIAP
jgi:putative endonuclease